MIAPRRVDIIGVVVLATAIAGLLTGCASGPSAAEPKPTETATDAPAEYDEPEAGWCGEFGSTLTNWGPPAVEIDDARFDQVIGVDFIGPADCYIEVISDAGVTTSVVAVFLGDDPEVAEFLSTELPSHGWVGAISDPTKGGVMNHPEIGDLGYSVTEDARTKSINADGPAIVVTLLRTP